MLSVFRRKIFFAPHRHAGHIRCCETAEDCRRSFDENGFPDLNSEAIYFRVCFGQIHKLSQRIYSHPLDTGYDRQPCGNEARAGHLRRAPWNFPH
jgi:hypothetical protein